MSQANPEDVLLTRDEVGRMLDLGDKASVAAHIAQLEHDNACLRDRVRRLKKALEVRDAKIDELGGW